MGMGCRRRWDLSLFLCLSVAVLLLARQASSAAVGGRYLMGNGVCVMAGDDGAVKFGRTCVDASWQLDFVTSGIYTVRQGEADLCLTAEPPTVMLARCTQTAAQQFAVVPRSPYFHLVYEGQFVVDVDGSLQLQSEGDPVIWFMFESRVRQIFLPILTH